MQERVNVGEADIDEWIAHRFPKATTEEWSHDAEIEVRMPGTWSSSSPDYRLIPRFDADGVIVGYLLMDWDAWSGWFDPERVSRAVGRAAHERRAVIRRHWCAFCGWLGGADGNRD